MDITEGLENKSIEELYAINRQLTALIREKERERNRAARDQFAVGDRVWFRRTKTGEIMHGTVRGINRNTLRVQKAGSHVFWAVSPSMCHKEFTQLFLDDREHSPVKAPVSGYSMKVLP